MTSVWACGLSTLDLTYRVPAPPPPGIKIAAESAAVDAGGPALNAARTARALGAEVTLVTALGNTPVSSLIREFLGGVTVHDVAESGYRAPVSSAVVDVTGARTIVSANAEGAQFITPPHLGPCDALLIDGHLMDPSIELARTARERGIPVILDGGSWKDGLDELAPLLTVAALSDDFAVPGTSDPLAWCAEHGIGVVLQTHGAGPIVIFSRGTHSQIEVPQVEVVDTLGAGDVFHGALAFALATGSPIGDAIRGAAVIASESVRHEGALTWAVR